MRQGIRIIAQALLLWFALSVERTLGLPVIFFVWSIEWGTTMSTVPRYFWFIYSAVVLMSLFAIALPWAFLILVVAWMWFSWGGTFLSSKTARLLLAVVFGSVVSHLVAQTKIGGLSWVYLGVLLVVIALVTKQDRLRHYTNWRKS